MDGDAPGLERYDRRCRKVYEQGERHEDHLCDVVNGIDRVEDIVPPESHSELGGRHHDRYQVEYWNTFKGGTGYDEAKQSQEEGRKRTDVDCKQEDRNPQENPTLVRTKDPSTPDDDAISYDILNQIPGDGSVHKRCLQMT